MSLRVEWYDANTASLTIARQGTEIGDFPVGEEVALVMEGDECAVMEGTIETIRRRLLHALDALNALYPTTEGQTADRQQVPSPGDTLSCGHQFVASRGPGIGYAKTSDGEFLCYACADERQREEMRVADRFTAYVSTDGKTLTTWSGGVLARVLPNTHGVSRSGWSGSKVHTWRGRDESGAEWYGRNGGPGMAINLRRAKGALP